MTRTSTDAALDHVTLVIKPHRYGRNVDYRNRFQNNPAFQELLAVLAGEILAAYETPQVQGEEDPVRALVRLLRTHGLPPRQTPAIGAAHDSD